MKTEAMTTPLGIDTRTPSFSWHMTAERIGARQTAYRIEASDKSDFSAIVWDSGKIMSSQSVGIIYDGEPLKARTRYYWRVTIWDEHGDKQEIGVSWFETGLFGKSFFLQNHAQWIGSPYPSTNTDDLNTYLVSLRVRAVSEPVGVVLAARNRDNYLLFSFDMRVRRLYVKEYSDNTWTTGVPSVTTCGRNDGYPIAAEAIAEGQEFDEHLIQITVRETRAIVTVNNVVIADDTLIPDNPPNQPRKAYLMLFGLKQERGSAVYDRISIANASTGEVYQADCFDDDNGILSSLGTVQNGKLIVKREFHLISAVPPVSVRRAFSVDKKIKSARLYASAMGFYEAYINGEKIGGAFFAPGFTDYRRRMYYQTYDLTAQIKQGQNTIGAVVTKGYYTGFVGYSPHPMIYGRKNAFIGVLALTFEDGDEKIIVTDDTWEFSDKTPVIDADFQQGETYDARLKFDWNAPSVCRTRKCAVLETPRGVILEAQKGPHACMERILSPIKQWEAPKGHFIYDFGQNIVGTIRLKVRGMCGLSIKLRYGEMCAKNGTVYVKNLRTAASTDSYTCGGDTEETFIPSFTAHGFRYLEISGNGISLKTNECIVSAEGLVLTNTPEQTGTFVCSDAAVNQLQNNIQWGQRGNSLLVYTDCPQRNERMGWTGDAQVFAGTAAYNMDVQSFMNKWLTDLRDAQRLYHKNGAIPDTAPLGGDNRPDGCGGWGDAAVIVPWEMYRAYGDLRILKENYEMMKRWVAYQSGENRQNCGLRTLDGIPVPENSDLSKKPYLQVQQRRGDHLAYDETTPFILSATAYAAHSADLLSRIASLLGHTDDAEKYRRRFENIRTAFQQAWVKEDGSIAYWGEMSKSQRDRSGNQINRTYYSEAADSAAHPSQTAYALAIDFHLMRQGTISRTAQYFSQAIQRNGGKPSVGFLGVSHLAPALSKIGLTETAFTLLLQTEYPGWLYSVKNGATTIWERWNSYIAETDTFGDASMNSFNHYAYGAIGQWMYRTITGIDTGDGADEAGYKKIILKPTVGGSLTYAKGSLRSPHGMIRSHWQVTGSLLHYTCTIPPNTTAVLYLPASEITENKKPIEKADGVTFLRAENGVSVFRLESGSYDFIGRLTSAPKETYHMYKNEVYSHET